MFFKKKSFMERGKFIRECSEPEKLAFFKENRDWIAKAYRKFRFELIKTYDGKTLNRNEWIMPGRRGFTWEYGPGKIGFSVEGKIKINNILKEMDGKAVLNQKGDDESNLYTKSDNLPILAKILGLTKRRKESPMVPNDRKQP